ncbi:N-6 DNA methylase [Companilactobacillus baiquanensis]|uniref:N-6 DNA methylase n=1 Tax=Companilactobacillus baiquanensis TaxID=2486005 RepID=A0ABW1UWB0_9LACO|nr:N-6 DNA methylase [Companilactobacillus baiquanensis]
MGKLGRDEFYKIAGVKQHAEFERYLRDILFKPKKREEFYQKLLEIDSDVYVDTFRQYFEEYAAERKSNQQDYTPDSISHLLSKLTQCDPQPNSMWTAYDPTAGTGSLLIQNWKNDQLQENIFSYQPHNYIYRADELADNSIPYLLHNLAIRGMNCVVVHGDTLERTAKQVYFVQNAKDDFMSYSSVNVMPHTDEILNYLGLSKWEEPAIDHIEDEISDVHFKPAILPMQKRALPLNKDYQDDIEPYESEEDRLQLKDIATVERAKAKKVYPRGTIVIQISATRGQIGLLKSSGLVGSQYACIDSKIDSGFLFYLIQTKAPRHFNRVQQGLNLTIEDIETIPVAITFATRPEKYEQTQLNI